jgi:HD-GYP domain-containing protein (c-di-GMP phosphodiesterase class II)
MRGMTIGKKGINLSGLIGILQSFVDILTLKDHYTEQHSDRVKDYAVCIARALGLDEATVECCKYAGLMHDIGKIGISAEILNKDGPLKDDELATIRQHPLISEIFLSNGRITKQVLAGAIDVDAVLEVLHNVDCPESKLIRETALSHHERYNGCGYPRKLKGDQIPLTGYILGIADSFDAMTSKRPYRGSMGFKKAVEQLTEEQNKQQLFDPRAFEGFLMAYDDIYDIFIKTKKARLEL